MILQAKDTKIEKLGVAKYSTKIFSKVVQEQDFILCDPFYRKKQRNKSSHSKLKIFSTDTEQLSFLKAGQRKKIYFESGRVVAGIVTCGGICPGINVVIRSIVMTLYRIYNCKNVLGFQYGLKGFVDKNFPPISLKPQKIEFIHQAGGSILGTSRGIQNFAEIVNCLVKNKINQLYIIGGDGTFQAALAIQKEIKKRDLKIALIAIPKTIDNDISFVAKTFGFDTAVEAAANAIQSASVESRSVYNGIGLVKLMGRNSGFIAANASLAQRNVDFVLIPEQPFGLQGKKGFLQALKQKLLKNGSVLIVAAEGAGQELMHSHGETDESGNPKLADIGKYLSQEIVKFCQEQKIDCDLKYIDPSYIIRSVPANTQDTIFCGNLGKNAVHAAMAGFTSAVSSIWHGVYCYFPLVLALEKKYINLKGKTWTDVLELTRQDTFI